MYEVILLKSDLSLEILYFMVVFMIGLAYTHVFIRKVYSALKSIDI